MDRKICPFLGLPDDESTPMAFPSEGNFCHKAHPAAAVSPEHQAGFCLTGQHTACPVFLARAAAPLPAALASPQSLLEQKRKMLGTAVLSAAVLIFYLAMLWANGSWLAGRMTVLSSPVAPASIEVTGPLSDQNADPFAAPRSTDAIFAGLKPEPVATRVCPLPKGWENYTIQPTDSIYRLSLLYGVSVQDLQVVNCMGRQTSLLPGSTLFIPARSPTPSSTAVNTPTRTVTLTRRPVWVPSPTEGDDDDDRRPRVQPTSTQPPAPTQPAPTQAAPTQAAPTQAAPTQPAPTQPPPTQVVPTEPPPPPPTEEPTPEPPPTSEPPPADPGPEPTQSESTEPTPEDPRPRGRPTRPAGDEDGDLDLIEVIEIVKGLFP